MPTIRGLVAGTLCALFLVPSVASAQAPAPAGVVTTLEGNVTATRAATPQPVKLSFKDNVFLQDRVVTAEESLARMLLGGKAVVTVRERSTVTITEIPGRSLIEIDRGKFALAVARERMRPGEVIEIRTPNAIAGVRGSVIVTEVHSAPGARNPESSLSVLTGSLEAQPRDPGTKAPIGTLQNLGVMQQFRVVGVLGSIAAIRPDQLPAIRAGLQPKGQRPQPAQNQAQLTTQQMQTATALAQGLIGPGGAEGLFANTPPPLLPGTPEPKVSEAPIESTDNPEVKEKIEENAASASSSLLINSNAITGNPLNAPKVDLVHGSLTNPGFETGDLTGWTLTGAGGVISAFGPLTPREGNFMALIHTGSGSVFLSGCGFGKECTRSTLSQTFNATKSIVTVSTRGYLLSNEFPTFTSSNSQFNDRYVLELLDSSGKTFTLFDERVNGVNFIASPFSANVAGFPLTAGRGIASFDMVKKTQVIAPGNATFRATVSNFSDSAFDSAFIVDAVEVLQDPPLFFISQGHLAPSGTLHTVLNGTQTHDSLLMVCCGATAALPGPALFASNSEITFPFSVVSAIQGGHITSSWPGAMIQLEGGRYTLGPIVTVFDVAGSGPTDQPLQHSGTFLDATNASINTGNVMNVDSALVAATAPLLKLKNSTLATNDSALNLSFRANVTSLGPLFALNNSNLTVGNGALVNLRNGSSLFVTGDLVSLTNGSTLSLLNGPLASVSGNSILSVSGGLVSFGGTGNVLNVNNNLCSVFGCSNVGGLNFALTGGASAANVSVSNPIKGAGTVNMAPNAAAVVISGAGSKVNVGN